MVTYIGQQPAQIGGDSNLDALRAKRESHGIGRIVRNGEWPDFNIANLKLADFFTGDYDNNAAFVVLAHLSEQNNHPEIARREAEKALAERGGLFQNRVLVAVQSEVLPPIQL